MWESWKLPHPPAAGKEEGWMLRVQHHCSPFLPWGCWVPGGAAPILWVSPCLGMALMFSALSLQHTPGHAQQQPDALEEASTAAVSD